MKRLWKAGHAVLRAHCAVPLVVKCAQVRGSAALLQPATQHGPLASVSRHKRRLFPYHKTIAHLGNEVVGPLQLQSSQLRRQLSQHAPQVMPASEWSQIGAWQAELAAGFWPLSCCTAAAACHRCRLRGSGTPPLPHCVADGTRGRNAATSQAQMVHLGGQPRQLVT